MFDIFSKEKYFTSSTIEKSDEQNKETDHELKLENYHEIQNGNGILFEIPQMCDDNDITFKITGIDSLQNNIQNNIQYVSNKNDDTEDDVDKEDENDVDKEDENVVEDDEDENVVEDDEDENEESDNEDENKIYLLKINDYHHSYFLNKKEAQESILSLARNIKLKDNKNFPDSYIIENTRNEIKVIRVFDFIFFKYHYLLTHFQLEKIYKFTNFKN
jgi:hypothetical protein